MLVVRKWRASASFVDLRVDDYTDGRAAASAAALLDGDNPRRPHGAAVYRDLENRPASEHSSDEDHRSKPAAHGGLKAAERMFLDFVDHGVSRAQRAGRCARPL